MNQEKDDYPEYTILSQGSSLPQQFQQSFGDLPDSERDEGILGLIRELFPNKVDAVLRNMEVKAYQAYSDTMLKAFDLHREYYLKGLQEQIESKHIVFVSGIEAHTQVKMLEIRQNLMKALNDRFDAFLDDYYTPKIQEISKETDPDIRKIRTRRMKNSLKTLERELESALAQHELIVMDKKLNTGN